MELSDNCNRNVVKKYKKSNRNVLTKGVKADIIKIKGVKKMEKNVTFRVKSELKDEYTKLASEMGFTLSGLIRYLLYRELSFVEKRKKGSSMIVK